MFNRILRHRLTRAVCWYVIFTLVIPLYTGAFPAKAYAQSASDSESESQPADAADTGLMTKIAVIGLDNRTGRDFIGNDYGISQVLTEAAKLGLEEKEKIEFMPKGDVLNYIESGDDISEGLSISIGQGMGAEQVIFGAISDAAMPSTEQASVKVELNIFDVQKNVLVAKSISYGSVYQKGFSGTPEELIAIALKDGIKKTLDESFSNMYKYGIVTLVNGDTIHTNLSVRDGVAKGALIAVTRDSAQIATLEVDETTVAYARANVVDVVERTSIKSGDRTRLIYTPSTTGSPVPDGPKARGKKKMNPLVGAVVLGALIMTMSGKSKAAEPPQPQSGAQIVASRDGKSAVYCASGCDRNYIPAPPTKIADVNASALAACGPSTNCNTGICVVPSAAYDFTFSTSPPSKTIPGGGYQVGFDLTGATTASGAALSVSDLSNLKIATCNPITSEWELVSATVGSIDWLGVNLGAYGTVSHFTPYAVVIDNRPSPLPAPTNFAVSCEDGKALASWDKIQDAANTGYLVYNCSTTQCTSIRQTISTVDTTSVEYNVSNGVQVCLAVTGKSSSVNQAANSTTIKCTTPSATACNTGISLISPPNNADLMTKPTFTFMGSGTSVFYMFTLKDSNNAVISTVKQDGELASNSSSTVTSTTRKSYTLTPTLTLTSGTTYNWVVVGYNADGQPLASQQYTFEYNGTEGTTGTTTNCTNAPTIYPPGLMQPSNGMQLTTKTPKFFWNTASNATGYILTVNDPNGKTVYYDNTSSSPASYGGTSLIDNVTYSWHIISFNNCTYSTPSADYFFTKVPGAATSTLPIPQWVTLAEDGKSPIISGDQYVILNWRQVNDALLAGYQIYRSDDPSSSGSVVEQILKEQLNATPSNPNCPTFSETNPGYCDVSVTNGKEYFYRIAAIDAGYTPSALSIAQSTTPPLQRPVLMAPGSVTGETIGAATPTFTWLPVDGENLTYTLTLREQTSQNVIWLVGGIGGTFIDFDPVIPLNENSTYQWTVFAQNDKGIKSENSQTFKFTVGRVIKVPGTPSWCKGTTSGSCAGNPGGPPYEYNISGAFDQVTIYWKRVTTDNNIAGYWVYRDTDSAKVSSTTANPLTFVSDAACENRADQVCFVQTQVPRGVIYYYAVSAHNTSGIEGYKSPLLQIRYDLRAPVTIYPTQDQVVYDPEPEFSWFSVTGVTKYRIQVDKDGSFNSTSLVWNALIDAAGGDVTSAKYGSVTSALAPLRNPSTSSSVGETYFWRVCAINTITTSETACTPANKFYKNLKPPEQKNPFNEYLVSMPITFNWLESPGADTYQFRVCEGYQCCDSTSCPATVIYSENLGKVTSVEPDLDLENCNTPGNLSTCTTGIYSWQIRALDSSGATSGEWRDHISKSFYKIGSPAPELILPSDQSIIMPSQNASASTCSDLYGNITYLYNTTFTWMPVVGSTGGQASGYKFKIIDVAASQDAGKEVIYEQADVGGTSYVFGECTTGAAGGQIPLAAGRLYKWNVTEAGVPFVDSNAKSFYTGLPAPRLVAPDDGKEVILSNDCDTEASKLCVHFEWDGGDFSTNGTPLPGVIGARSYDIQILDQQRNIYFCERKAVKGAACDATNRDCYKNTYVTSCDMSTADAFNNDRFTWMVRSRDSSDVTADDGGIGMPSQWSQSRSFTLFIPGPILSTPPDSGDTCYDDHLISARGPCVPVTCQNMRFWWSPIPLSDACYRIEVSDTSDFRNLLLVKNSVVNAADFVCQAGVGCNSYKTPITAPIPMTNGVKYYWRVGASVAPEAAAPCGTTWIYSDTWDFLKKPNSGFGLGYSNVLETSATLSWTKPDNCQGDTADPLSTPDIPPNAGGYIIYGPVDGAIDESSPIYANLPPTQTTLDIASLSADTDYRYCIAALDESGYYTDYGHVSEAECVSFKTQPAATTP